MRKAKYCLDCIYHSLSREYSEILTCAKGHKPRFYPPKRNYPFMEPCEVYGWKRRCLDYKEVES